MCSHHTTGLKQEIESNNQKFMDAFAKHDPSGIAALYTEDCKIMPQGVDVMFGKDCEQQDCMAISGLMNLECYKRKQLPV